MRNPSGRLVLSVLAAGSVLAVGYAQNASNPAKDVAELAREVGNGKDLAKPSSALAKRYGHPRIAMRVYNPRGRGGIGIGRCGSMRGAPSTMRGASRPPAA